MPFEEVKKIWMNGRFVDFADAKIHVLTHALHYGSGLFEGIRCYDTRNQGPAIFRLDDHIRRLFNSAKIYRMVIPFTKDEIVKACVDAVELNRLDECYIRPLVYRGYAHVGVNPIGTPIDVAIAVAKRSIEAGTPLMVHGYPVTTLPEGGIAERPLLEEYVTAFRKVMRNLAKIGEVKAVAAN